MPCNCGKKKISATSQSTQPVQNPKIRGVSVSPRTVQGTPARGQTQSFALQLPDGRVRQYGSELERRAARVRLGGDPL